MDKLLKRIEFINGEVIRDPRYIRRWGFRARLLTVYVHRYAGGSDTPERPHNHPWKWWASLVMRGELTERRWLERDGLVRSRRCRRRLRNGITLVDGRTLHQKTHAMPGTLTLVIGWRRVRQWGFIEPPVADRSRERA